MSPDPSKLSKSTSIENVNTNIPIHVFNEFSSDEDTENNAITQDGYQLLSDDIPPEDMEETLDVNEDIDYSSLSGIMSALERNGPTTIDNDEQCQRLGHETCNISLNTPETVAKLIPQDENCRDSQGECGSSLWSRTASTSISLDHKKEEEIRNAMSSFTLPPSSIPSWAQNLSDEQWKGKLNLEDILTSVRKKN